MGLLSTLRLAETLSTDVGSRSVVTPYDPPDQLERFTYDQLFDAVADFPITRAEAMRVPAVARARHMITTTIARADLLVYDRAGALLDPQPTWTRRTDQRQPRAHRIAWTVDDLIFHGESLWLAERDNEAHPLRVEHVPHHRWEHTDTGGITVDGQPVTPASRLVHIGGMHEGILTFGAAAIRGAAAMLDAAVDTARRPFRLELHDTGEYPMTRAEIRELIADARAAMLDNAGVVYTAPSLEARLHQISTDSLLVAGRESFAVDVARLIGVPSAMVDAHSTGATMTYTNVEQVIRSFLHLGLVTYMLPITARLSLDDITPAGQTVRFDLDDLLAVEQLTGPAADPTPTEPAP